ncbi:MAG TPA: DUF6782 family putative metallopeptidase [Myxococcales bacterium]
MNALGIALALVLAQSGLQDLLGDSKPSPAALQAMVEQTLPKVAKVMGATPKKVAVKVVDRVTAAKKIRTVLEREYPGDKLERLGTALKLIHLVEPGVDVTRSALDLYSTQVSGFYDATDHTLFLIDDQPEMLQGLIIPHELAHALQDQKIGLDQATKERMDSEDAQLAMMAAVEGNAQAVAAEVMTLGLEGDESGLKEMLGDVAGLSATMATDKPDVPPWLALQLQFPYVAGAQLVKAVSGGSDPSAVSLLKRLPSSTAQVLEPALYKKDEKPLRGAIDLAAALPGAAKVYETVVGRANIELLGQGLGVGWRGDRLEAVRVDGGKPCAAWAVAFGKAEQAERFAISYSGRTGAPANTRAKPSGKTVSSVSYKGSVVVVLEQVPEDKADAIEAAARKALH